VRRDVHARGGVIKDLVVDGDGAAIGLQQPGDHADQ
jgi:hypothetical protein